MKNTADGLAQCPICKAETEHVTVGKLPACVRCGPERLKETEQKLGDGFWRVARAMAVVMIALAFVGIYAARNAVTLGSLAWWIAAVVAWKFRAVMLATVDDQIDPGSHREERRALRKAHEAWLATQPLASVPVDKSEKP